MTQGECVELEGSEQNLMHPDVEGRAEKEPAREQGMMKPEQLKETWRVMSLKPVQVTLKTVLKRLRCHMHGCFQGSLSGKGLGVEARLKSVREGVEGWSRVKALSFQRFWPLFVKRKYR